MTSPTVTILQTCLLGALGLFLLASLIRSLTDKRAARAPEPLPEPMAGAVGSTPCEVSPYVPPMAVPPALPPPLPASGVSVRPYRALDLLWLGFLFFTFYQLSLGNARMSGTVNESAVGVGVLIGSMVFQLVLAGMTMVVMVWRIRPVAWLGLRWARWPWVLLIAPVCVVGMWMCFIMLDLAGYMKWVESLGGEATQDTVKLLQEAKDPVILALMAVAAVVVAPVCEEIVFRGYLYPVAKKFSGPWIAGVFSALVFACAHGGLTPLLPLFIFGVVLVVAYEKTGSLWVPVAIHFCFNGATVAMQLAARALDLQPPTGS